MVAAGGTELYQEAQGVSLSLMLDTTYAHCSDFMRAAEWCSISFFYTEEQESTINATSPLPLFGFITNLFQRDF